MSLYQVFFTEDEYKPLNLLFIYLDMITEMPKRWCWNQDDKIPGEIVTENIYKVSWKYEGLDQVIETGVSYTPAS